MKKIHLAGNSMGILLNFAACSFTGVTKRLSLTRNPAEVTCKACKKTPDFHWVVTHAVNPIPTQGGR